VYADGRNGVENIPHYIHNSKHLDVVWMLPVKGLSLENKKREKENYG
jgi:hypothetical protein